ncbi:MAG: two-component sensor histidine kinase [Maritimibacter sp.]|nr:two-component sensor histidine kinase [Maritimibacter sp.]
MTMPQIREAGWGRWSLPLQFLLAGAVVMVLAMLSVGLWVATRIEQGVVQSSAVAAADYVEAFIAPLGEDFAKGPPLAEPARRALEEAFASPSVAERIVSYKIWRPDGLVLMASDADIVGRRFDEADDLRRAWTGQVAASYEDFDDPEDDREAALGIPLLEVYSPLHAYFSGDVIAVVEFYQDGTALAEELSDARRTSWLVVGGAFLTSGVFLFGIVQAGGRTIDRQRRMLETRLAETRAVSAQNAELKRRVVSASSRATAQTERAMRQLGADLHDGPGQHLALAALRLDALLPETARGGEDAKAVRASLDQALAEIRALSRGLAIPDLDEIDMATAIERAVQEHRKKTGMDVALQGVPPTGGGYDYARKLCAYRFLQEALSNAARHSGTDTATVRVDTTPAGLAISIRDEGLGFERAEALRLRHDGGQGLLGLIDRAESLGGAVDIDSATGRGACITLTLPMEEAEV